MNASATTRNDLRRLRWRITGLITFLSGVIVVILAATAIQLDRQLSDQLLDTELLSQTNRVAGSVSFDDDELDVDLLADIESGVVIGVRPPFDVLQIVDDNDLWDSLPEMSDGEANRRIDAILDDLDNDELAFLLDLEEPIDRTEMQDRLIELQNDALADEALRRFLLEAADEQGLELDVTTTIYGDRTLLADDPTLEAVERVADDGEDAQFDVGDGLVARGVPIRSGAEVRGAVVAIADPTPIDEDHAAFRRSMLITGIALIVGASVAAWFVAGRTIRPAAKALANQERFLADAAHELRTPIAAIRATAESGAEPSTALERVVQLASSAGQMTDDLLTLARIDADRLRLEREPVRLDLLVEAAIDGDPKFSLLTEETVVMADPQLLTRAILNLLDNARRHGGASVETPAIVSVEAEAVRVRDHGLGLDPATADHVFERFRSSASSSGHGLGLPLSRWLAEAHGGRLELDSSVSPGVAFVLTIPAA